MLRDVARALHGIHELRFVHRDVADRNVLCVFIQEFMLNVDVIVLFCHQKKNLDANDYRYFTLPTTGFTCLGIMFKSSM